MSPDAPSMYGSSRASAVILAAGGAVFAPMSSEGRCYGLASFHGHLLSHHREEGCGEGVLRGRLSEHGTLHRQRERQDV